ncbi:hypothetical protein ONZ45_g481 [Pleurotus djamor]|nr:hypothetical protein ONZ45_g481 [Pleurotus djamor]
MVEDEPALSVPLPLSPPATDTPDFASLQLQHPPVEVVADAIEQNDEPNAGEADDSTLHSEINSEAPPKEAERAIQHGDDGSLAPEVTELAHPQPQPSPLPPTPPAKNDAPRSLTPNALPQTPRRPAADSNGRVVDSRPSTPGTPTLAPSVSASHKRSMTISKGHSVSIVLISSALETIASSKEAKKSAALRESTQHALELVRSNQGAEHTREVFEPLRLACETRNEKLMIASLDCISKLVSYSFFAESDSSIPSLSSPPGSPHPNRTPAPGPSESQASLSPPSLVDLVTHTITSCHSETTPEAVSLQIVKALLAMVLSPTTLVHHSSLLKAVRTVYNVFLLSTDPVNQMVAQGGLTQMVHHIFTRCRPNARPSASSDPSSPRAKSVYSPSPRAESFSINSSPQVTSRSLPDSLDASLAQSSTSEKLSEGEPPSERASTEQVDAEHPTAEDFERSAKDLTVYDLFIKDAFLVFRALCKLTMKPLNTESERDLKSHAMRSKLLSLHLVLTVLNSHMSLIVDSSSIIYSTSNHDATSFIQAINQYLCLCLSRNAVSPVPQVFEKEIEVLLHEIFIPILEMKTSTLKQKSVILGLLSRLCQEPQALVELYLNYDCDSEAADNIYEHLMNIISKIASQPVSFNPKAADAVTSPSVTPTTRTQEKPGSTPLTATPLTVSGSMDTSVLGLSEGQLKRQGIECLVTVLRSLVSWGTAATKPVDDTLVGASLRSATGEDIKSDSGLGDSVNSRLSTAGASVDNFRLPTPDLSDDPTKFESAKQKKTTLLEGIKKFNFKPKRGIQFLIDSGLIPSKAPQDIATFLLSTDGLSKAMIGEYLGEGDEENIAIMHAFVDLMDFKGLPFVEALRLFLQSFRLPGEAQKIDRFMLKFAERYIAGNPQSEFANADGAYVLAYSVILLNTDAHNPQIKKRMTNIINDEIRMKDEIDSSPSIAVSGYGLANALANVGRDLQKEAYVLQSNGMANKTEALFKTMVRSHRKGSKHGEQFFSASHFIHVKPMFEVAWIPFLAGLSGPLQDTDDLEVVELCLDGFKSAIRIVCFFDLELERNAFVTTLAKFTFLNNLGEMKTKNMEAIKTLLDIAVTEGNNLKGSWHEVLTCVSQLEHMQLISSGVDVPDSKKGRTKKVPNEELANESRSTHITVAADMVFSLSHYLSGTAIVDFVQALSDVSWEEIQSSGLSQQPRVFSLQKLVEISYYNMTRIRLEWSNLWDILGEHFNQVCCHNNPHVAFFALDSLRQLAMRFLEKEELPHFKFQKDFLKPFEYTMIHNQNPEVRDMVLQCLQQMIQARVQNMRSGWRTMFGVFSAASKVLTERIASSAFEIVTRLNNDHFLAIVRYGAFADMTVCITEFCKVSKYQKISLLAIAMLRGIIPVMLKTPECSLTPEGAPDGSASKDDPMIKYWFPELFSFYDIIMNGEDLEVRRLALDSLFTTLKTYGSSFPVEFWDTVCQELLFPIFAVLKSNHDLNRFSTQEDMSVWLSSTMIQALRDLIDLYTYYFDVLERFLDGLLDLLCICICQENDTLARIGTSCLQKLLEDNISKLSTSKWDRIITTFVKLFKTTTPHQLFDERLLVQIDDTNEEAPETENNGRTILPAPLMQGGEESRSTESKSPAVDRRRIFKQIIVKCVLQLHLIETTNELLRNEEVYRAIPPEQLLRLMGVLDHSYQFARMFNEAKDLRTGLWKVGFMKHLPNLLKQESSSASTLVHILLRMYYDPRGEHQSARAQIADRLMPLGLGVIQDFCKLRPDTQGKNIVAWTPVVAEILDGFCRFDDKAFLRYLPVIYPLATDLLSRDITPEVRLGLKSYFVRVGYTQGITEATS